MKIKLKIGFKQRMVNTIDGLATITKKMYIIYREFCFILFMLYLSQNQAALEKNPFIIESVTFLSL